MARAVIRAAGISLKHSIEICCAISKKKVDDAKKVLEDVINGKRAIPFKRFTNGAGHKKKMGPGKFPKKAAAEFIKLINAAKANAQNKGLAASGLIINHICANKAASQWRHGRKRRRKMKRTNVEIYVKESEKEKGLDKEKSKKPEPERKKLSNEEKKNGVVKKEK